MIKAYGERLDPWPQRRPLEILEILAKIGLKKKAFYNQIWKNKQKRGQKMPHKVIFIENQFEKWANTLVAFIFISKFIKKILKN